jgi:pullulanase/glycogen debranching enzyme
VSNHVRLFPYAHTLHCLDVLVVVVLDVYLSNDTFTIAPWNELVIYEMHVGTFHVKGKGHPGTLDSAVEKLPYLRELGINAVEVMPIMEFPGEFSWGYNPSHPFAIESIYGGPDVPITTIPNLPIILRLTSKPVRKSSMGCPAQAKSASALTRW